MLPDYYKAELYHYGVLGMKWGVRKATRKGYANESLKRAALAYDTRAAMLTKKSEKAHSKNDLDRSNRRAAKAASYDKKAAKLRNKALDASNEVRRTKLEQKAAAKDYKAAKARLDANRISKTAGYGIKAMNYSIKSDEVAKRAAKARKKIASNEAYIAMMNRKVSSLSQDELNGRYAFVKEYLDR